MRYINNTLIQLLALMQEQGCGMIKKTKFYFRLFYLVLFKKYFLLVLNILMFYSTENIFLFFLGIDKLWSC